MPKKSSETQRENGSVPQSDAVDLLKAEHKKILDSGKELEKSPLSDDGLNKLREFCLLWMRHADIELVFPKLKEANVEAKALDDAMIGADFAWMLLADLVEREPKDQMFTSVLSALLQQVTKVIELEENEH